MVSRTIRPLTESSNELESRELSSADVQNVQVTQEQLSVGAFDLSLNDRAKTSDLLNQDNTATSVTL